MGLTVATPISPQARSAMNHSILDLEKMATILSHSDDIKWLIPLAKFCVSFSTSEYLRGDKMSTACTAMQIT